MRNKLTLRSFTVPSSNGFNFVVSLQFTFEHNFWKHTVMFNQTVTCIIIVIEPKKLSCWFFIVFRWVDCFWSNTDVNAINCALCFSLCILWFLSLSVTVCFLVTVDNTIIWNNHVQPWRCEKRFYFTCIYRFSSWIFLINLAVKNFNPTFVVFSLVIRFSK